MGDLETALQMPSPASGWAGAVLRLVLLCLVYLGAFGLSLVLDDISLKVDSEPWIAHAPMRLEPGSMNVLLGPTLSGKTTLMRLMAGLDRPTSGRVLVDGKDVTGQPVRNRSVAMVYQQFVNYPSLTVFENIASPLRVQGRPNEEVERRVQEVAGLLRLQDYLERSHHQYDILIFFTYLYAPTVLGARISPHKTVLVPTAHDEPAIHLGIYKELFSAPAAIA